MKTKHRKRKRIVRKTDTSVHLGQIQDALKSRYGARGRFTIKVHAP